MAKSKSKVPCAVHSLLKQVLCITEFDDKRGEYVSNSSIFRFSMNIEEYSQFLSFTQSVSAGEI